MKEIAEGKKPLENRLGISGWIWAGRYSLERYLYTLQRISGLALILYGIIHLIANGFRIAGGESWESIMSVFEHPGFTVGEYLVFAAFIFHSLNGARLILQQVGLTLGRPKPPVYPYTHALRRRRPIVLGMGMLIIALLAVVLFDFIV